MSRAQSRPLDRRRFLARAGAGTVASLLAPSLSSKAFAQGTGSKDAPVILGVGAQRFEWVRGWGTLPAGMKLGPMHGGVAVDSDERVYLSTDGEGSIIVFDPEGKFVRAIGKEWIPEKEGSGTHDIQVRREGGQDFVYLVSLFRHEFAKLTTAGEVVWVKGFPQQSGVYKSKDEFAPTGIAIAQGGDIYVADGYGANYVHRYDPKGEYVSSWGGKSTEAREPGKFNTCHKIAIDVRGPQPTVLVTDRGNHQLQWFTLEGKHLRTVDGAANDFLRLPAAVSLRGKDLAIGDLKGRVTILDEQDRATGQIGDSGNEKKQATNQVAPDQWVDGQFVAPHGISFDGQGNLYVSEWLLAGRVVKLKRVS